MATFNASISYTSPDIGDLATKAPSSNNLSTSDENTGGAVQAKDEKAHLAPLPQPPPNETVQDPNIVKWEPHDRENPQNWSNTYKGIVTAQLGLLALVASLGSSITSAAENRIASATNLGYEVSVLSVSLYIVGFALGPIVWAPVSEVWGRRISMLPAVFCLGIFSIGTAVSKNATSVFITRFFAGVFGSAPVSNVSAALGDIWPPKLRGTAMMFYAITVMGGPTFGPLIGAAVVVNPHLGW